MGLHDTNSIVVGLMMDLEGSHSFPLNPISAVIRDETLHRIN